MMSASAQPAPGPRARVWPRAGIPALTLLVLVSCAPGVGGTSLPVESPEAFSSSGTRAMPERWWTAFGDRELDRLVEEALRSNFDLEIAWHRLREAQAIVDREGSGLFPDLDAFARGEVRRSTVEDGAETLRLGLTAEYEVDLWGRIRSRVDAARYRAEASFADYQTAALSISAEVARTWYQWIEAREQVELLEEQTETNENVLSLLENRFGTGQIRSVDILRQRRLVESTREERVVAESRMEVLEHQLAVLLGRPPQRGVAADGDRLPEPPPLPAAGIPAELVQRRPDVRSAYARLLAADRDVAVAITNRYPRLTLSATVSTDEDSASNLFEDWFASLVGSLVGPLLDGGERAAEVDRTEAIEKQRLYEYGRTALTAFREVEDALVRERKQVERIESLEDQVELAETTYEQLRLEYFNGLADYIDVLTALIEEQQLQRDLLAAERTLLEIRIALYRALAGGFETHRESDG